MSDHFRLTIAQLNPTVGDIAGNAALARDAWEQGKSAGADMVALPEMFITGYSTQDLVNKPAFHLAAMAAVEALATECADGPTLAIGGPYAKDGRLYNGYHICRGGKVVLRQFKHFLPNYNVFDEVRQFNRGDIQGPYAIPNGPRIGSPICEDAWYEDVAEAMVESGAEILVVPNGSPYFRGKFDYRMNAMVARVVENEVPLVYLNMVGGQDDQAFDGGSFVLNRGGELALQLPLFDTAIAHVDFTRGPDGWVAASGEKNGTACGNRARLSGHG